MPTLEAPPAKPKINERDLRYYGWRVVLAANLGIMVGFSIYAYSFSVFVSLSQPSLAGIGRPFPKASH